MRSPSKGVGEGFLFLTKCTRWQSSRTFLVAEEEKRIVECREAKDRFLLFIPFL